MTCPCTCWPDGSVTVALVFVFAMVNGISGYTFDVRVEDNGEPGRDSDRFRIQIGGPTSYDSDAFVANGGLLTAGNIQTH